MNMGSHIVRAGSRPPLHLLLLASFLYAETGYLADQAQLAWQDRDKPGQTEQAVQLWRLAVKAEPNRTELWIKLTKAAGRAVRHAATKADRQQWAETALGFGREATQRAPQSSDAWAAYGEALGQWANTHRGLHSLKTVKEAVVALKKAITLDPKNHYAHMLLASFYHEAPRAISVGNAKRAREEARLAVLYGPTYAINHLVLAKTLLDAGQRDQAASILKAILRMTPPADAVPETLADQQSARALLKSLGISVPAQDTSTAGCQEGNACSAPTHP